MVKIIKRLKNCYIIIQWKFYFDIVNICCNQFENVILSSSHLRKFIASYNSPHLSFKKTIYEKIDLYFYSGIFFMPATMKATDYKCNRKDSTARRQRPQINYPYTIDHPDNWDIGSTDNTMVALSALKAYENGNIDESYEIFWRFSSFSV